MRQYDLTDEERFDADPHSLFRALLDEGTGRTHWWEPTLRMHPRSGAGEVGSTLDIEIPGPRPIRWSARIAERVDDRLLRLEYTGGDFVGEGIWTFEPVDGQTRVRFRWRVRPHSLPMRLFAPLVDLGARHSRVIRQGFAGLRRHVQRGEETAHP